MEPLLEFTTRGVTDTPISVLILVGLASLVPTLIILSTHFVRVAVVLVFARQAIGLQTTPPNIVLIIVALLISLAAQGDFYKGLYDEHVMEFQRGSITEVQMYEGLYQAITLRMSSKVDPNRTVRIHKALSPSNPSDAIGDHVVYLSFVVGELQKAFTVGFLIFLPFLVIDLIVASIVMSVGMIMVPPLTISLPLKILVFVLIDGWTLLVETLLVSI